MKTDLNQEKNGEVFLLLFQMENTKFSQIKTHS